MNCPCGLEQSYDTCCGPYLQQKAFPNTPEALMRSRYTAFTQNNMDYIQETMTGPALSKQKTIPDLLLEWLGLEVLTTSLDPNDPTIGYVEFIARYQLNGINNKIHECSEFCYKNNRWYYFDGKHLP